MNLLNLFRRPKRLRFPNGIPRVLTPLSVLEHDELVAVKEIVLEMHNLYAHGAFIRSDCYEITEKLTEALGWELPE